MKQYSFLQEGVLSNSIREEIANSSSWRRFFQNVFNLGQGSIGLKAGAVKRLKKLRLENPKEAKRLVRDANAFIQQFPDKSLVRSTKDIAQNVGEETLGGLRRLFSFFGGKQKIEDVAKQEAERIAKKKAYQELIQKMKEEAAKKQELKDQAISDIRKLAIGQKARNAANYVESGALRPTGKGLMHGLKAVGHTIAGAYDGGKAALKYKLYSMRHP